MERLERSKGRSLVERLERCKGRSLGEESRGGV